MGLPKSFTDLGIMTAGDVRKTRRLMIGTEGLTNSGKTEFLMSAPGPKIIKAIDIAFDSSLDNSTPPTARNLDDCGFDVTRVPMQGTAKQEDYIEYFKNIRSRVYTLSELPELRTLCIDGDSDWWELQVLAEYGRTNQIHPWQYAPMYAVKRAIIKRLWESGKIIIATNKLKDKYEDIFDDNGKPEVDERGKTKQRKVAGEYKRQGFPDQDYLWQLQIRHIYKPAEAIDLTTLSPADRLKARRNGGGKTHPQWGIRIMKCKSNPVLEGDELWGDKANFRGLVEHVYPNIPTEEWGFEG